METAYDEVKTHILGPGAILRSKTPDLVLQEVHGLMLAHYAVRRLIHEAARKVDEDPDRLSFVHAVRVVRRRVENPAFPPSSPNERLRERVLDEILEERVVSSRGQRKPRGVKRKMSGYPLRGPGPVSRRKWDWTPRILTSST